MLGILADMFKLFPENQPTMSDEFIHAVASHYDIEVIKYDLASSGIENSTVIIQSSSTKYVLRIYRQDKKTKADIETEINFMKHLRNHGLPIPSVIPSLDGSFVTETHHGGKVWHSIMMEFIEGVQHHSYTKKLIHDLSRVQGKIHILGEDFASDQQKIITDVLQETLFYPGK